MQPSTFTIEGLLRVTQSLLLAPTIHHGSKQEDKPMRNLQLKSKIESSEPAARMLRFVSERGQKVKRSLMSRCRFLASLSGYAYKDAAVSAA